MEVSKNVIRSRFMTCCYRVYIVQCKDSASESDKPSLLGLFAERSLSSAKIVIFFQICSTFQIFNVIQHSEADKIIPATIGN